MLETKRINEWLNKKYSIFIIATFLLWIKTYIVYLREFNLGVESVYQHILLFINPISSALFFLGIAMFLKGNKQRWTIFGIQFFLSFILYANVCYYRFFNDFITLPVLTQTKNFGELGGSATALMKATDIFYFADVIIVLVLILLGAAKKAKPVTRKNAISIMTLAAMVFIVNLVFAEIDRPQLLSRTFDRNYIVKYLGAYNFTIYDAITSTRSSAQRAFASTNDIDEVKDFTEQHYTKPNPEYFGKAKGMNVLYVSMESLQNFTVDEQIDGQDVMPFLKSLKNDKNTFYFNNFFHQVGQGKTSDAEFMIDNSLFPLPQGAVFTLKAQNTFEAAPQILKGQGYTTAAFHGNYKTFWNRDIMYQALGYDAFFDAKYYDMSKENTINYGMKDKPMIKETMPYLQQMPEPFMSKMILLSNHFPFVLDDEDIDFPAANTNDGVVNRYFQTAHYMDEALEQLFDNLKASGLYDHTIIVLYGDHYGISSNHNPAMGELLNKEITPYENAQLQRVPLFIHVPGVKGKIVDSYGGEIDIRDTVLHLLGIDTKKYISFGSDLLSPDHREIVPFRNGDFVTPKYTSISGKCYENPSGNLIDKTSCQKVSDFAKKELQLSDKVVYGDLLRFYTPDGFTPVDSNIIDYSKDQKDILKSNLNLQNVK